jgi:prepilin-type N-terminal cleavage/methylation domain-containing protein
MDPSSPLRTLRARGFSLIELMVVVLILCILTILTMSRVNMSNRDKIKADCQKNLQTIFLSLTIYANDNKGQYPFLKGATTAEEPLSLLVPRCTTVTEMFICPGSGDRKLPEGETFARRRISYAYYMGRGTNDSPNDVIVSDRQITTMPKNAGQPIFSKDGKKPAANHNKFGGNFITLSGEAASSGPSANRDFSFGPNITLLNPR